MKWGRRLGQSLDRNKNSREIDDTREKKNNKQWIKYCWVQNLNSFIGHPVLKTDLFQSCGHCWVFQICWHIKCSTFTASSFRIWNSSTGILSSLLALFVVKLPKTHLISHSRMSSSRLVITPSWLSGSWRSFLYSSSVYSCHLFLIFCFC